MFFLSVSWEETDEPSFLLLEGAGRGTQPRGVIQPFWGGSRSPSPPGHPWRRTGLRGSWWRAGRSAPQSRLSEAAVRESQGSGVGPVWPRRTLEAEDRARAASLEPCPRGNLTSWVTLPKSRASEGRGGRLWREAASAARNPGCPQQAVWLRAVTARHPQRDEPGTAPRPVRPCGERVPRGRWERACGHQAFSGVASSLFAC